MNNPLTKDLNLEQFMCIIANDYSRPRFIHSFTGTSIEESKTDLFGIAENMQKVSDQNKAKIFSIKEITQNKTAAEIIEIIKTKLSIVDNDIQIWNKMIRAISNFNIADELNHRGEIWALKQIFFLKLVVLIYAK